MTVGARAISKPETTTDQAAALKGSHSSHLMP
jgi:hypothetical protein